MSNDEKQLQSPSEVPTLRCVTCGADYEPLGSGWICPNTKHGERHAIWGVNSIVANIITSGTKSSAKTSPDE